MIYNVIVHQSQNFQQVGFAAQMSSDVVDEAGSGSGGECCLKLVANGRLIPTVYPQCASTTTDSSILLVANVASSLNEMRDAKQASEVNKLSSYSIHQTGGLQTKPTLT